MRVECVFDDVKHLKPSTGRRYPDEYELNVTIGREYAVCGVWARNGEVGYLLLDDIPKPNWYPAELFVIVSNVVPYTWRVASDAREPSGMEFVLGYEELVDLEGGHLIDLIERDRLALTIFQKRKDELEEELRLVE